ncbi:MAG: hypothetical protein M3O36_17000, partial [Myxococcota bacterium]|nr:hypothetical protein [Myxococcota bacterium]
SAGGGAGHESCPVCSGAQTPRPRYTQVTGVPCGERLVGVGFACEPALLRSSPGIVMASFQRAKATRDVARAPGALLAETPTPPPRRISA